MSDMKDKIISNLISGRPWTYQEFWDALPDVVYSKDIKTKAIWRDDPNWPKYIKDKNK